jgi:hypothetical protein
MSKARRKAHARYMREWRRKRKERLNLIREDLSNLFIGLDRRKKFFLKAMKHGEDLGDGSLFSQAIKKYGGIPRR